MVSVEKIQKVPVSSQLMSGVDRQNWNFLCWHYTRWDACCGESDMNTENCNSSSMKKHVRTPAFTCCWRESTYRLFTLRKPCSPLRMKGQPGFIRVNRLWSLMSAENATRVIARDRVIRMIYGPSQALTNKNYCKICQKYYYSDWKIRFITLITTKVVPLCSVQ